MFELKFNNIYKINIKEITLYYLKVFDKMLFRNFDYGGVIQLNYFNLSEQT